MTNTTTKTIATMYSEIINGYSLSDEHKAFLLDRQAKATKKSTSAAKRGPSAKTLANRAFTEELIAYMATLTDATSAADLAAHFDKPTGAIASLISNARKNGAAIEVTKIKGKSYYSISK